LFSEFVKSGSRVINKVVNKTIQKISAKLSKGGTETIASLNIHPCLYV